MSAKRSPAQARPRSCARDRATTTTATTSSTTPRSATTTTTRCSTSCGRSRRRTRSCGPRTRRPSGSAASRSTSSSRYEHPEPMLSLANARSAEEFRAWEARLHNRLRRLDIEPGELRFVSEPKIDGLAISLTYEDGEFVRGATRGDGRDRRGRDPQPAHDPGDPAADRRRARAGRGPRRGLLPARRFAELNEQRAAAGRAHLRQPPQRAAGTIRQLDPAIAAVAAAVDLVLRDRRPRGDRVRDPLPRSSSGCASAASGSTARSPSTRRPTRSSSAASGGRSGARGSTSRSTGSSSRSTSARSGASSASSAASRAGRSPGSSRR